MPIRIRNKSDKQEAGSYDKGNVSSLRKDDILAVLLSDIHLSEKAPIVRSAEPSWLKAQARPLQEIQYLTEMFTCPVLAVGDIFDKWNPSPSLINWTITNLPDSMPFYAVPGQHDLRHHSYDDIQETAYWTLHAAGAIIDLGNCRSEVEVKEPHKLVVYPFPWGTELNQCEYKKKKGTIHLALVHKYIWQTKFDAYPGADKSSNIQNIKKQLKGYSAAAFGDNHKGWNWTYGMPIMNCGTLMRRKADEIDYKPQVGLLMTDGTIRPYYLDCSQDKFIDMAAAVELVEQSLDMTEFLDELRRLGDKGLDFVTAVKRFCKDNNINRGAVKAILQAIEK